MLKPGLYPEEQQKETHLGPDWWRTSRADFEVDSKHTFRVHVATNGGLGIDYPLRQQPLFMVAKPEPLRFVWHMLDENYPGYLGPLWFDAAGIAAGVPRVGLGYFHQVQFFTLEAPQK
jgi:hypothetical protein